MLLHCWLKILIADMLVWLSVWSEVQIVCIGPSWCHCHWLSVASVKSRLVLPFWCRLTQVILEKRSLNGCSSSSSFMELKYALLISDLHCYNCCKMCFEIWREQFVVRRMLLIKHFWSISSEITVSILELHELILWLSETAFIVVTHRTF